MNKINKLSEELKQEKEERQKERSELLKEREQKNQIIEGMRQFQELILNINMEDTDEEISVKVRKIARKVQRQVPKESKDNEKRKIHSHNQNENKTSTYND